MKTIISIIATLILMGCNGLSQTHQMNAKPIEFPTLPDHLIMGKNLLSHDTIEQEEYALMTEEECSILAQQTGLEVPEGSQLIGQRAINKQHTLAAYKIPLDNDTLRFKVYLVTRGQAGDVIDQVDLQAFHTSEHQGPMRLGGNRFYTTDADLRIEGPHRFVLHRVMTLTSVYLKNHTLTELWRVEWDNHYEIDDQGYITYKAQQETHRTPADLADPVIATYQSRDRN